MRERNFRTSRSSKTSGVPAIKRLIGLVIYARPSFSVKLFIYCSCATRVYRNTRLVTPSSGSVRGVLLTFRRDKRNEEEDRFAASRRQQNPRKHPSTFFLVSAAHPVSSCLFHLRQPGRHSPPAPVFLFAVNCDCLARRVIFTRVFMYVEGCYSYGEAIMARF